MSAKWTVCYTLYGAENRAIGFSIVTAPHGSTAPVCERGAFQYADDLSDSEVRHRARLNAAAPDLLAAAEGALSAIERMEGHVKRSTAEGDMLRAAIKRAREGD